MDLPSEEQYLLAKIDRALAGGKAANAVALAATALSDGVDDPFLFHLVAWDMARKRDFGGAYELLQRGLAIAPDDPNLQLGHATLLRMQGRIEAALEVLEAMLATWPDNAQVHLEAGFSHEFGGALEVAAACYARVVALDPGLAAGLAGLASVLARLGRVAEARKHVAQALRHDPTNVAAQIAQVRCDLEEREPAKALQTLVELTARTEIGVEDRILVRGLEGDALGQLGRCDEAFAAYAASKALFSRTHGAPTQRSFVERIVAALEASATPPTVAPSSAPVCGHAFLLGFPRSGTTLVENILAAAPGVLAIEERPTLRSAELAYLSDTADMAALQCASAAELEAHRAAYWECAARFAGDLTGKMLVDMDPLKGIKLPLIVRMFPRSRIIFMQRDPREVVWSCFKTSFAPTAAAREFTNLGDTARHYDAIMHLTEATLARFPLAVHRLRYDRLVNDFDGETRALCSFLDLEWTPALREFASVAERRGVATASVSQVRKGLYDGTGQWRKYAAHMEGVMPILMPWVERFGFSA